MALEAGIDVELPGTDCFGAPLLEARRLGGRRASSARRSGAARPVARSSSSVSSSGRYVDVASAAGAADTPAQRALARTIARKSLVLLKNDGVLPLSPDVRSVAVIGPNADDARNLFGDYSVSRAHVESLREMSRVAGENVFSIAGAERRTSSSAAPSRRRRRCADALARAAPGRGAVRPAAAT